jgi:hypothetical protein
MTQVFFFWGVADQQNTCLDSQLFFGDHKIMII